MSLFEVLSMLMLEAAAAAAASGETTCAAATFMGDGDGGEPVMIFDVTVLVMLCWLLWKWQELMVVVLWCCVVIVCFCDVLLLL